MTRLAALALIVMLAACSSESDKAKQELAMIKTAHGSSREICVAQRKIANAYLSEGADKEYPMAKLTADIACQGADLDERLG